MVVGNDVAMEMMRVFQKGTRQTFFGSCKKNAERWERNVDDNLLMEFVKSAYVLRGLVLTLGDYI